MHTIAHRAAWTPQESLCWKLTTGEKSLATLGNRDAQPFELHPCPISWSSFLNRTFEREKRSVYIRICLSVHTSAPHSYLHSFWLTWKEKKREKKLSKKWRVLSWLTRQRNSFNVAIFWLDRQCNMSNFTQDNGSRHWAVSIHSYHFCDFRPSSRSQHCQTVAIILDSCSNTSLYFGKFISGPVQTLCGCYIHRPDHACNSVIDIWCSHGR